MARSKDLKTPLGRFSFTKDLFVAKTGDNGRKSYGCTHLFPKGVADLTSLKNLALEAATAEWGDKAAQWIKDGLVKSPFLDGDSPQGLSKKTGERHDGYAGHIFIRYTSGEDFKPKVFDQKRNPIMDAEGLYSGCYGYAVVNAFTWENDKNGKGISFGVSLIQKAKDGDRLGGAGGPDPDQYLETIEDAGAAPDAAKSGKGAAGLFG